MVRGAEVAERLLVMREELRIRTPHAEPPLPGGSLDGWTSRLYRMNRAGAMVPVERQISCAELVRGVAGHYMTDRTDFFVIIPKNL